MYNLIFFQVIQKRFNGYVNFDRTWEEYKKGFGSVSEEYWLGRYLVEICCRVTYSL